MNFKNLKQVKGIRAVVYTAILLSCGPIFAASANPAEHLLSDSSPIIERQENKRRVKPQSVPELETRQQTSLIAQSGSGASSTGQSSLPGVTGGVEDTSVSEPGSPSNIRNVDEELEQLLSEPDEVSPESEVDDESIVGEGEDPEQELEDILSESDNQSEDTDVQVISDSQLRTLNPRYSTVYLDELPVSHLSDLEVSTNILSGDFTIRDTGFQILQNLGSSTSASVEDNVLTTEFHGNFLQVKTAQQLREVTTTLEVPVTIQGFRIRFSLTGSCELVPQAGENPPDGSICSYTPPVRLVYDENEPTNLIPTDILLGDDIPDGYQFREVVPASDGDGEPIPGSLLARIEEFDGDGYIGSVETLLEGEKQLGIDVDVRNSGFAEDTSRDRFTRRSEEIDYVVTTKVANVRQVIKQNSEEAVLGRTVRALNIIPNDESVELDIVAQLASIWLPDAEPTLEGTDEPYNANINVNIFRAADAARVPANSFAWYHAGIAKAESLPPLAPGEERKFSDIPVGRYNGIWLGLSPVIDRSFEVTENGTRFRNISAPRLVDSVFEEAGSGDLDEEQINVDIFGLFLDEFGEVTDIIDFDFSDIPDAYTQVGLDIFERDAIAPNTLVYRERTNYIPHVSFTGTKVDARNRKRYYTGLLWDYTEGESGQKFRSYLGADYQYLNPERGVRAFTGLIGYINPDRDYYSQVWGEIAKTFSSADKNTSFTLGTSLVYAIDQADDIGNDIFVDADASKFLLSAGARFGSIRLGVDQNIDFFPNSDDASTVLSAGIDFGESVTFAGFYTPYDEGNNVALVGANLGFRFGTDYNSPRLSLGWSQNEYRFDTNNFIDNRYTLTFRVGRPGNPFGPR
ncbi:hypothetical protein [Picosynechococcus sp. PCC 7117]|uniref:hypothetical protein n=1 Tax=Picosynechococcus sp. PCC 7117 TaxID=195498 RepID=UPI000810597A|nr:hypothetical protein [Picosynechococcus sp. PCC 7117]ANV88305.1 hypothetical protein AWQ22_13000 [Picosynechococcus sp. PCC 7117]